MGSLADALALIGLLAMTAVFVAGFADETDPAWSAKSPLQRALAMPMLTGLLLVLWLLALVGGISWPAQIVDWVAGWSHAAFVHAATLAGLAGVLGGVALLARPALATRGATLQRHLVACQLPYAVLLSGLGALQAGLGSS